MLLKLTTNEVPIRVTSHGIMFCNFVSVPQKCTYIIAGGPMSKVLW